MFIWYSYLKINNIGRKVANIEIINGVELI